MQTKDKHILTDGEVLDAVVNEYDEIAHICELYKYKIANSELPKLTKIIPQYYKPKTPASKKCKHLTPIKVF